MAKKINYLNEIKQKSRQNENATLVKKYEIQDLIMFPENVYMGYDVEYTTDLETAIKQSGFTDPIEICKITPELIETCPKNFFEEESSKPYVIISGNRRFCAGKKVGMKEFPGILREFKNYVEMRRAVLEANMHRGKGGKPLQTAKEIRAWQEQLKLESFKGDKRKYLSEILGMSQGSIQRFGSLLKMIPRLQELVDKNCLGLSNITKLGNMKETEQENVLRDFDKYINSIDTGELEGDERYNFITRDICISIIENVKNGIAFSENKLLSATENTENQEGLNSSIDDIKIKDVLSENSKITNEDEELSIKTNGEIAEEQDNFVNIERNNKFNEDIKKDYNTDNELDKKQILQEFVSYYFSKHEEILEKILHEYPTCKNAKEKCKKMQEIMAPNGFAGNSIVTSENLQSYTCYGYAKGLSIKCLNSKVYYFSYNELFQVFRELFKDKIYTDKFTEEDEESLNSKYLFDNILDKIEDFLSDVDRPKRKYEKNEIDRIFKKISIIRDYLYDELVELAKDENCTMKIPKY